MKVIFLDIDGVLNSGVYLKNVEHGHGTDNWASMIDPAAVALLNELVAATSAKVVISSSWRITRSLSEIWAYLRARGFTGEIIGCTPLGNQWPYERGREIAAWLKENGPANFVILDDDSDMAHLKSHLVQTTFAAGLQREHVEKAKRMLEEQS